MPHQPRGARSGGGRGRWIGERPRSGRRAVGLPVVALAAALLVTAGLVLLVRQLLHDVDRRTTTFAVLVGLLLTASHAVLVLLGR